MGERVRRRDLAFLNDETLATPRHNTTVEIFEPGPGGFDHDRLVALVADRLPLVPRYRQRVVEVPGHLAAPVWVDDDHFDLGYHVRRSALPRPGSMEQLRDLVARIVSRPLDRSRPLWEVYAVEGLEGDRVALLHKTHQALVDGLHTVDLGQVLLERGPEARELDPDDWTPRPTPSAPTLLAGAVAESVRHPTTAVVTARAGVAASLRTADRTRRRAGQAVSALRGRPPVGASPLAGPVSQQRRVVLVETSLADHRRVRDSHGGTVNDVVLATVAGALRAWLMTRGDDSALRAVRALVPVSVNDAEQELTSLGSQIAAHHVDLPLGEASPVVRLHQVSYSNAAHQESVRGIAADRLARISGFAPTTFHAIGARMAASEPRAEVSIVNVPGPQTPLYAAGARLESSYPVPTLVPGRPLAVGVTSYDGRLFYGITADRDQVPDVDVLGTCLTQALEELVDLSSDGGQRARRGRRAKPAKPAEPSPRTDR